MKRLTVIATAALAAFSIVSCQQQRPAERTAEEIVDEMPPPLHLGAVHQVYPEQGFALLRIIGPMPKSGTVLITHPADGSNDRIGNLVVSSESNARSNIVAADIRSGSIVKGDRVFQYRNIFRSAAEETAPAEERPIMDSITEEDLLKAQQAVEAETAPAISEEPTAAPTPSSSSEPTEAPAYLDEIPDDISGWN